MHPSIADCSADRPCFTGAYQKCHQVFFQFNGVTGWDFYNVRYPTSRGGETQVENKSGIFTIENVKSNAVYTIKVQGCYSHFLAHSDCSPWVEQSFRTAADFGPDTCLQDFVWRGASPSDHVCVPPEQRDVIAADNSAAA
jgi:hypothetical protein